MPPVAHFGPGLLSMAAERQQSLGVKRRSMNNRYMSNTEAAEILSIIVECLNIVTDG
jgi:hypothetical protein